MNHVVGIDLSLRNTGIGVVREDAVAYGLALPHRRPVEKAKRARLGLTATPLLPEREDCLQALLHDVLEAVGRPTLAVIYDVPNGVKIAGAARVDVPAAWSRVVGSLVRAGVPVATVQDSAARKAITGPRPRRESRETVKLQTGLAIQKLYPDVELASDDVSDALAAAHLGAVALGWQVPMLARHADVKWSEWPVLPDPRAQGVA